MNDLDKIRLENQLMYNSLVVRMDLWLVGIVVHLMGEKVAEEMLENIMSGVEAYIKNEQEK